jgi:myo-inositol-hexaphosphate 3-phosphohydrolase
MDETVLDILSKFKCNEWWSFENENSKSNSIQYIDKGLIRVATKYYGMGKLRCVYYDINRKFYIILYSGGENCYVGADNRKVINNYPDNMDFSVVYNLDDILYMLKNETDGEITLRTCSIFQKETYEDRPEYPNYLVESKLI